MSWDQAFWLIVGAICAVVGLRSVRDPVYREKRARRGARTDALLRRVPVFRRLPSGAPTANGWVPWGWAYLILGGVILVAQTVDIVVGGWG
jgi:hypothetical protein